MGEKQLSFKHFNPWVASIVTVTLISLGASYYVISQIEDRSPAPVPTTNVAPTQLVTALGRLEPQGEVIKLSVANAEDSRVDKLFVKEGDRVRAGQTIAILQGMNKKQAALAEAKQNLAVWQAKLAQLQAGEAKIGEIAAQKALVARIEAQLRTETLEKKAAIVRAEAELRHAAINYRRYQTLHQEGAVRTADLDEKREQFETAQASLDEAEARLTNTVSTLQQQLRQERAMLAKLIEVRPVDLQVAQAQVKHAATQVTKAEADLDDIYVRVPVAGQILKINTRIGEQVNTTQGIVELGRTDSMYAIAEVYETDAIQVRVGQRATAVSEHGGFVEKLNGTVEHIQLVLPKEVKVMTRNDYIKAETAFWSAEHPAGTIFNFGAIMGFIIGVVIVNQILYSDVNDRLAEYATLKAIGYSDRSLLLVVFQEAIALAILGFMPGFACSMGMYALLGNLTRIPLVMQASVALQVFLLTVLMCAVSGALATRKLRSADPADVF